MNGLIAAGLAGLPVAVAVLAVAYWLLYRRWTAAVRTATAASLRAAAWREYAEDLVQDKADLRGDFDGAVISLELALARYNTVAARNAVLTRLCDGLRVQNAHLTGVFEALFPAADGDLRARLEWALFVAGQPATFFIPTQSTGDES